MLHNINIMKCIYYPNILRSQNYIYIMHNYIQITIYNVYTSIYYTQAYI